MNRKASKAEVKARLKRKKARQRHCQIWQSFRAGLLTEKECREEHIKTRGYRVPSDAD